MINFELVCQRSAQFPTLLVKSIKQMRTFHPLEVTQAEDKILKAKREL